MKASTPVKVPLTEGGRGRIVGLAPNQNGNAGTIERLTPHTVFLRLDNGTGLLPLRPQFVEACE
jgi:hypothetical protein